MIIRKRCLPCEIFDLEHATSRSRRLPTILHLNHVINNCATELFVPIVQFNCAAIAVTTVVKIVVAIVMQLW